MKGKFGEYDYIYDGYVRVSDNRPHGWGIRKCHDGTIHEGEFRDGNQDGRCKTIYSCGAIYVGDFAKGVKCGRGRLVHSDGQVYEGEWKDDKKNGRGKITYMPSGNVYKGEFKDDKCNGNGTKTYKDGRQKTGQWSANKFLG
jgi:hypothetical protein